MSRIRFGNYHSPGVLFLGRRWTAAERLDDLLAIAERVENGTDSRWDRHVFRQHVEALRRDENFTSNSHLESEK